MIKMAKKLLPGKLEFTRKELEEIFRRAGETSSLPEIIDIGRDVGLNPDTLEYHARVIANERKMPFLARVNYTLQACSSKIKSHPWIGAGILTGVLSIGYVARLQLLK